MHQALTTLSRDMRRLDQQFLSSIQVTGRVIEGLWGYTVYRWRFQDSGQYIYQLLELFRDQNMDIISVHDFCSPRKMFP